MELSAQYLSFDTIDFWARDVLEKFQPDALRRPEAVDVVGMIQSYLPRLDVSFSVGTHEEMGSREGLTEFFEGEAHMYLREDHWDALQLKEEASLRARATVAHELGHVVLHADYARRRAELVELLAGSDVFESSASGADVEWQAWAFAGCLLMPVEVILGLENLQPRAVGELFDVSPQFARRHMFRLKREGLL